MMKIFMKALGLIALALVVVYIVIHPFEVGSVAMPHPTPPDAIVRLDQGWPQDEADKYHKTSQGTRILPIAWFRALEVPSLDPILPQGRLASPEYLARFGFVYEDQKPKPTDLPIGFAIDDEFKDPFADPPAKLPTKTVGLTCAACHTGRLDVEVGRGKTVGVLVEGGSAMINLEKFQEAVGLSLFYTLNGSFRRGQFVARVLADKDCPPDETNEADIKAHLSAIIDSGIAGKNYARDHKLYPVVAGFARTDALGLIGNRVFGPLGEENQTVVDAPVNFPHLWDTAWFDWVQYNASIRLPMARNIGEALGVGAVVKPSRGVDEPYESTVRVENLAWMEDFLGGKEPLPLKAGKDTGLLPPKWNDFADKVEKARRALDKGGDATTRAVERIDDKLSDRGKVLYKDHCAGCHLPDRQTLQEELKKPTSDYWEKDAHSDGKFLKLRVVDLDEIGTDPNQAVNFYRRFAVVPNPTVGEDRYRRTGPNETISAEEGLYRVTSLIRLQTYRAWKFFDLDPNKPDPKKKDLRQRYDRYRTLPIASNTKEVFLDSAKDILNNRVIDDVIHANLGYKARPLDGIWATPPYFHNGSVPNLEQVLMPASCRAEKFYLGTMQFDPVKVGYQTDQFQGAFLMDTTIRGNLNSGHEFRNLTLEEFEAAMIDPARIVDTKDEPSWTKRWNNALGVDIRHHTDDEIKEMTRQQTLKVLDALRDNPDKLIKNPKFRGIRGVLGAEFTPTQRRELLEYLKSL
jgi:hypothetical protein